jgi:fibronectin type 3 domain-containing protein
VAQRGDRLEARGVAPRTTTSGAPLGVFEIELVRAEKEGDLAKVGLFDRIRVAPGESFHETWPLPPAGTSVRVAARSVHRGQRSTFSPPVTVVVKAPPAPPTAVTASLEAGGVVLGWTGGSALVYRKKGAAREYETPLDRTPTTAAAYRDTSVAPGDSWCYVVRAVGGTEPLVESAPSSEACVSVRDVFAPAAPTGVAALAAGGVVDVSWSPSTEADLGSYRVYRSDGGEPRKLAEVPAAETRYRDETAEIGPTYSYTVTAVDKDGNESTPSAPAKARPL